MISASVLPWMSVLFTICERRSSGRTSSLSSLNTEEHVLDFALTLCGRVVEAQHLENEVLVLDVRLLDQFLETVPVLTVSGSVDVQARILQQLGNDFLTGLAARLRQFVVEFHGAIGRSITLHGDVLRSTVVLQFGIYVSLERVEVGFLLVLLGYDRRVDRIEQIGLVDDGGHLLVVVGHRSHQVGVFQILLERVQAVSYRSGRIPWPERPWQPRRYRPARQPAPWSGWRRCSGSRA